MVVVLVIIVIAGIKLAIALKKSPEDMAAMYSSQKAYHLRG